MTSRFDGADALAAPLYLVAALLVLTPIADFLGSVVPLQPGNVEWRFATVGLLSGFVLTPLLGITLAMLIALGVGHQRFQRVLAVVNAGLALGMGVTLVLFLLDIVQLRSVVQAESRAAFESAALKAFVKHLCFAMTIGWMAVRGFRASRWTSERPRRQAAAVIIGS